MIAFVLISLAATTNLDMQDEALRPLNYIPHFFPYPTDLIIHLHKASLLTFNSSSDTVRRCPPKNRDAILEILLQRCLSTPTYQWGFQSGNE